MTRDPVPTTVTLELRITTTADGRRIYPRAPLTATCTVVALRRQYLAVRTPTGEEVWVDRSHGRCSAPRGGVPGCQGAPAGARACRWGAWTLSAPDLSVVWVESESRSEAASERERARR